jgi:hypothetical protein
MAKTHPAHRTREIAVSEDLRALFDEIADQPVPPRLIDLVEALEEKRRHQEGCGDDA